MEMGPVTPETVGGFELLYATPGTGDIAEIAGHLLLRIRINREPADPGRDVVISFLAATPESLVELPSSDQAPECRNRNWFNLARPPGVNTTEPVWASLWQSIKGLTGGFPVVMDVQSMATTLKTYTVEQDRTLRRYELIVTPEEKAGLLERLARYPEEELPRYYFFPQNCGSVLVRVLGEGIGADPIASFSPAISPPHSLVGLLLREGRITPATPDLHSFRDQGRLFRPMFEERWQQQLPQLSGFNPPPLSSFLHRKTRVRLTAVQDLRSISLERPELDPFLYPMASILQETETVFDPKDRYCRDTTGPVTAELRLWQQEMLIRSGDGIAAPLPPPATGPLRTGTPHTGLYPVELRGVLRQTDTRDPISGVSLETRALRQWMGSPSQVAMQRAGAVDLFALGLRADHPGVRDVEWTGLELHKFREGLGYVVAGPWNNRAWGIGLRVLEGAWQEPGGDVTGTMGGMSALLNLASSPMYRSHLYVAAGLDVGHRNSDWGIRMPMSLHGLLTIHDLQSRLHAAWNQSWIHREEESWEASLRLSLPISRSNRADWNAILELESGETQEERYEMISLGVELQRF